MKIALPESVIVSVDCKSRLEGVAVCLSFMTTHKNNYYYNLFLDSSGQAKLRKKDYLARFDATLKIAMMDYGDIRAVFSGRVCAELMKKTDIAAAIKAHDFYEEFITYEPEYREKLLKALQFSGGQSIVSEGVTVKIRLSNISSESPQN